MVKKNIFIIGFSGSGKTTVGKEAAILLKWKFVDIDQEIVNQTSKSIEEIFKLNNGNEYFRELEKNTLKKVIESEEQIVSTGGGIILDKENLRFMLDNGYVICLDASPATIFKRLTLQSLSSNNEVRPLLNSDKKLETIIKLKNERNSIYKKADYFIATDSLNPLDIAQKITDQWIKVSC
ncbi:MAG: shikimate kinase [Chloroflexi bacterium]|nr:shikimate kinase [Chloroflexota bacterium]